MNWAVWVAVAALVAAAGKFADDYHVRHETRSLLRERLTRWFIILDDVPVPDLVDRLLGGFTWRVIPLSVIIGGSFYAANEVARSGLALNVLYSPFRFLGRFLIDLSLWNGAAAGLGSWLSMTCLRRAARKRKGYRRMSWLAAAWVSPWITGLAIGLGAHRFVDGADFLPAFYGLVPIILVLPGIVASFTPVAIMISLTVAIVCVRQILRVVRRTLLTVFDVASSPKNSPLTYFSALLSMAILVLRVVIEATSGR